jgi:lipopolysaccharide biosynthesis regulator YciM
MLFSKLLGVVTCLLAINSGLVLADPFTPKKDTFVVAEWDVDEESHERGGVLRKAAWHIEQGQYPGQSNKHYGRAYALLSGANESLHQNPLYLYQLARVQQYEHEFDLALENLGKLLEVDPKNQNAWLLKANIYLTQSRYEKAQQACKAIAGLSDPLVLTACLMEVGGYNGDLQKSYDILSRIATARITKGDTVAVWLSQILAEQSLRLGDVSKALEWLLYVSLDRAPLSLVVLWADIMLAKGEYQALFDELSIILRANDTYDDALLLRVVTAEKQLGSARWLIPLEKQIALRIQRQDFYHAADLARYFIDIKPNAEKAKYWADVNWQRAKLYEDKQLLERANAMVGEE